MKPPCRYSTKTAGCTPETLPDGCRRNVSIKGRSKNMLLGPSGQNIYPEEIEDKLNNMPYVAESIIVQQNENW